MAARIQGTFKSAFKERPASDGDEDTSEQSKAELKPHVAAAAEPGVLAVVADTDVLSDRMWANIRQFFGQRLAQPFAGNRDFVINLVDNLFGSNDLIAIRSRASYSYPFTRVQEDRAACNPEISSH